MALSAVHIVVHGMVQGVGFRFYVREHAVSLGVKGWIRNCSDRTVEIHAECEKEVLLDFIKLVEKGPTFGRVTKLVKHWTEPEGIYDCFMITF